MLLFVGRRRKKRKRGGGLLIWGDLYSVDPYKELTTTRHQEALVCVASATQEDLV
jgi:hypothetical protein